MAHTTATRIGWLDVAEDVRGALETALGSTVVDVAGERGGYSPSFAARCRLADGRRVFVKAVSADQDPVSPGMLRHEIRVTRALAPEVPAPRLRHAYDDGHWVAAVFAEVDGRPPRQPWDPAELSAVWAAIDGLSSVLDPCPVAGLETLEEKFGADLAVWRRLAGGPVPAWLDAWSAEHLDRLARAEGEWVAATAGDALVHFDVRADNVLLDRAGDVWFVDWANAVRGASWIDTVLMLPSVALQGGPDPATALASTPVASRVDTAAVTALVVALAGFFTYGATLPPPPGLPHLRAFQAAQGEVARAWVRERLG